MFTIATNGYDAIFADWLQTQACYANKLDYKYVAFTKTPPYGISGTNSAWLKIPLIINALQKGYKWVFFIDADCKVHSHTPPIETVHRPYKSVYMGIDFSNRINSGVIIVKNEQYSLRFFRNILLTSDIPSRLLPKEDRNLYENGHVIFFSKRYSFVDQLDPKWNNMTGHPGDEYIWHSGERHSDKPRTKVVRPSTAQSVIRRLQEGPRYLLLRRLVKFYNTQYEF